MRAQQVLLIGAHKRQQAELPRDTRWLWYVPNDHANGDDVFEFMATDCSGDRQRSSSRARIAIRITPVNDPPVVGASAIHHLQNGQSDLRLHWNLRAVAANGDEARVALPVADDDGETDIVSVQVLSLPQCGTIRLPSASSPHTILQSADLPGNLVNLAQPSVIFRATSPDGCEPISECRARFRLVASNWNETDVRCANDTLNAIEEGMENQFPDMAERIKLTTFSCAFIEYEARDAAGATARTIYPILLWRVGSDSVISLEVLISVVVTVCVLAVSSWFLRCCLRRFREGRRAQKLAMAAKLQRVHEAVEKVVDLSHPINFIRYSHLRELGGLESHELCRDANKLTTIDTYRQLVEFIVKHTTVFMSHQYR